MKKPELLLPAGDTEAFYAAQKGGADAVYLGLRQFNARSRATNFTANRVISLVDEAKKTNMKVYVTLNTVVKNKEMGELLDTLWILSQIKVDAVIIQDWGVFYLIKKYFPTITVHASTQMANHNSAGANYSALKDFERVIMARELTMPELKTVKKKSKAEIEIFVHGALCYSFSGMCLFSSYLGGMSANRGLCKQPCRRLFFQEHQKKYVFSLKDNQLIDHVPEMMKLGVDSLKIEGRLKPAEYVYRVASAYRLVLDDPTKLEEAKEILNLDMGREKTSYFMGGDVSEAMTFSPSTGLFIGSVIQAKKNGFLVKTDFPLEKGNRLRIRTNSGDERFALKIKELRNQGEVIFIEYPNEDIVVGDKVFLANLRQEKFPSKLPDPKRRINTVFSSNRKSKIFRELQLKKDQKREQLFFRIDSLDWLRKIRLQDVDGLILSLSKKELDELNLDLPFLKQNSRKIFIELPKFIPEKDIPFYEKKAKDFIAKGYQNFFVNHLSQKMILPKNARVSTSENVYIFNDAAIRLLQDEKVNLYTYPQENEMENLIAGKDRAGLVPLYYRPELFHSRMPVKLSRDDESAFKDDEKGEYIRSVKNGMTIITPIVPVSLLQYKSKLYKAGFRNFLFDLSHEKPSKHLVKKIILKARHSEQLQPSVTYNFTKGLT